MPAGTCISQARLGVSIMEDLFSGRRRRHDAFDNVDVDEGNSTTG